MTSGRFFFVFGLIISFSSGCGHTPVTRTLFDAIPSLSQKDVNSFNLNPNLRYLRVTVQNRTILMVQGYTERSADGNIEIWYSNGGEVIRIQNGRVIGTAGLETDWVSVNYTSLPSWQSLKQASANYHRERDEMPGYRFGIKESVTIYPTPVPTNSKLVKTSAKYFRWYEEVSQNSPNNLPSARFAVREIGGVFQVAYAEQCFTETYCLSWQLWPVGQ